MGEGKLIGSWNEWGRLRECVMGFADDTVEPDYIPALMWLSDKAREVVKALCRLSSLLSISPRQGSS